MTLGKTGRRSSMDESYHSLWLTYSDSNSWWIYVQAIEFTGFSISLEGPLEMLGTSTRYQILIPIARC